MILLPILIKTLLIILSRIIHSPLCVMCALYSFPLRRIRRLPQLNSDLKDALVTQYAELNGTGNNYFYVDRKQGYRLSSAILHVYDTGYIRVEAISQEVNNENCYVLWTNNSYPQNKKIGCDLVWIKENFLWN